MAQIIIYETEKGNVAVCWPTGELPIDVVLTRDCPQGAFIVEDSILPQGSDAQFFDAWELSGSSIIVNLDKAKTLKLAQFNQSAIKVVQNRQLNTLASIPNSISDADFVENLTAGRASITNATTTDELVAIANPA